MNDQEKNNHRQVHKVLINASIETVWNILVKTDEVLPFFFGSVCETRDGLVPGSRLRMISPSRKNVAVVGEVLEFEPPHRYSHTLKFTQYDDPYCVVRYELREVGEQVEFSLVQEKIPTGTKTEKSMQEGAGLICNTLKNLAETGRPGLVARLIMLSGPLLGLLSPAKTKAENWPLDGSVDFR